MPSASSGKDTATRLVVGLAFCAGGALLVALAPHRTLTCAHPARPASAAACLAAAAAAHAAGDVAPTAACPLPPDIECRIEARIAGLVASEDARFAGIRDFDLMEGSEMRHRTSRDRSRKGGVERTLLFAGAESPVDPGWHVQTFATPEHRDRLRALAREPAAARTVLVDSPKLSMALGFVLFALGALTVFSAIAARR